MRKYFTLAYGLMATAACAGTCLYAIGFLNNVITPTSLANGVSDNLNQSVFVNLGLLGLCALQMLGMSSRRFRNWLTRVSPVPVEQSTYVLVSSLSMMLLFLEWRSMNGMIWNVQNPNVVYIFQGLSGLGWVLALLCTLIMNPMDSLGLQQALNYFNGKEYTAPKFRKPAFYQWVRHPRTLGFIIALFATPNMTVGHLMFAIGATAILLINIRNEENALIRLHGEAYAKYQSKVPMIVPISSHSRFKRAA